ncbi:PRC-barrel domain-containing protein [Lichenihabitans sp. Uapishka_5]|uniref:PRC-barrel domain-containing protein n=1 Tax=Lichenihabitans sp. Uapishka_5 TaxID=3037302 RepID=UPI0029E8042E|nr:PRC-barrel domain-containing protein [Lichenihabitans sp. Uapishka_5]MDX7953041.1 PRC-barrel domain-containing protein [Lichenihabitans sp. Uapishka_5]
MRRLVLAAAFAVLAPLAQAQTPPAPSFVPVPDNAILSTNVTGLAVTNGKNEKVGSISDVVIESGRLSGYVLSVGGFLGIGTHHVVVAPAGIILSYDAPARKWHARIDATKDQLKAAPAFLYEGRWGK